MKFFFLSLGDFIMEKREWVIDSHRGAFKEGLLENTVESYTQSYKEGANMLECDLRLTKDRQIVLIHNRTIDHLAKDFAIGLPTEAEFHESPEGPVKSHTLAYLKAMKFRNDAEIMTLPEFLDFLKKLRIGAQIEMKEMGFEDLIAKCIAESNLDYKELIGPVVCTSFNWGTVLKLQKAMKSYETPLYLPKKQVGLAFGLQAIPLGSFYGNWVLRQCRVHNIWGFTTYYKYIPISRIAYAHSQNVKFCPRVPDDIDLINKYIDAGVDGFETDSVPLIRECIEKKGFELWPLPK
jgi:glycerophosphoryl diester phosphodiesterase